MTKVPKVNWTHGVGEITEDYPARPTSGSLAHFRHSIGHLKNTPDARLLWKHGVLE